MATVQPNCLLCNPQFADKHFRRILVWEDEYWRLTTSIYSEIPGFSYLEPKRHIPYITDLDGEEARTFGEVLARVTKVLREVTNADLVYIYVFGDTTPHLHLHLAPHVAGDACSEDIVSREAPLVPEDELQALSNQIRDRLAALSNSTGMKTRTDC